VDIRLLECALPGKAATCGVLPSERFKWDRYQIKRRVSTVSLQVLSRTTGSTIFT